MRKKQNNNIPDNAASTSDVDSCIKTESEKSGVRGFEERPRQGGGGGERQTERARERESRGVFTSVTNSEHVFLWRLQKKQQQSQQGKRRRQQRRRTLRRRYRSHKG